MKTASFFTFTGPGRVSIALYAPPNAPAGFRRYAPLVPRRDMLKLPYDHYREIYTGEILAKLDPHAVAGDLQRLAGVHEPVLLCWKKPPFTATNWCHRRMVAEWLGLYLDLQIAEHTP